MIAPDEANDDLAPLAVTGAVFSPCRTWRYALSRDLGSGAVDLEHVERAGLAMFVGLNPSTADETTDDPTIRRCMGYARDWGFRRLVMCNLFAFRSTDPSGLWRTDAPVGADNDYWLRRCAEASDIIVCAWGAHRAIGGRDRHVCMRVLSGQPLMALGHNRDGSPKHPLYLKRGLVPLAYIRQ